MSATAAVNSTPPFVPLQSPPNPPSISVAAASKPNTPPLMASPPQAKAETNPEGIKFYRLIQPHLIAADYPVLLAQLAQTKIPEACFDPFKDVAKAAKKTTEAVSTITAAAVLKESAEKDTRSEFDQREVILKRYFAILKLYKENPDGKLIIIKTTGKLYGIASKTLLKIIIFGFQKEVDTKDDTISKRGWLLKTPENINTIFKYENNEMHAALISPCFPGTSGSYGTVSRTLNIFHGMIVALKYTSKDKKTAHATEYVQAYQREIRFHTEVLKGKFPWAQKPSFFTFDCSDNDKFRVGYATEYFHSDLHKWLYLQYLTVDQRLKCCSAVIKSITEMHAAGIQHRDLKPDNVCIEGTDNDNLIIRIIDWARATSDKFADEALIPTPQYSTHFDLENYRNYRDKKIQHAEMKPLNEKLDVYALGVSLYQILTRKTIYPYELHTTSDLKDLPVKDATFIDLPLVTNKVPPRCIAIIKTMVALDPKNRPSMTQVLESWAAEMAKLDSEYMMAQSQFFSLLHPFACKKDYPILEKYLSTKVEEYSKTQPKTAQQSIAAAADTAAATAVTTAAASTKEVMEKENAYPMEKQKDLLKKRYFDVLSMYAESPDGKQLILKRTGEAFAISSVHLANVLLFGYEQETNDVLISTRGVLYRHQKSGINLIYKLENEQMNCVMINPATVLGKGGFAKVYKVINFFNGNIIAFKYCSQAIAACDPNKISHAELTEREIKILTEVIKGQFSWAPKMPFFTVDCSDGEKNRIGIATELFEGDLLSWLKKGNLTNERRMQCCVLLIDIVVKKHAANLRHGDIKPQNILFNDRDNNLVLCVSDWSHAAVEAFSEEHCRPTPTYSTLSDFENYRKMKHQKIPKTDWKLIHERRDVYALGMTLLQVLAGKFVLPYEVYKEGEFLGYPKPNSQFNGTTFDPQKFNPRYLEVIKGTLHLNQPNRPLMVDVQKSWNAITASLEADTKRLTENP